MRVKFERVGKNRYRLEKSAEMRSEALFYTNEEILPLVTGDRSLEQLKQTAQLPDLESPVIGMPDMHQGYGIPVGGIMASEKLVSVGCVGMDINCGVRLLRTEASYKSGIFSQERLKELVSLIESYVPVGLGQEYKSQHEKVTLEGAITEGAQHLVKEGYGTEKDLVFCEEEGFLPEAKVDCLSSKALERARNQIGTLGSGNHFLELQRVDKIFDKKIAKIFGLEKDLICFMIHSGSRALGHQTCLDYTKRFQQANQGKRPDLIPTKNLASAEIDAKEGRDYLAAMRGAINFAFANRQMMTHKFRQAWAEFAGKYDLEEKAELIYDVAHNSAKWEEHRGKKVLVHRKGATRAFPAGHKEIPQAYKAAGHPAFVPGSMGTPSYVIVGTDKEDETFYSVNHGAGRAMSRTEAKKRFGSKKEFERQMGKVVSNTDYRKVADEAPKAYKDIDEVIKVLADINLTKKVARLQPLAVVKGD